MKKQITIHKVYFIIYVAITLIAALFLILFSKSEIHIYLNKFHTNWLDPIFRYTTDLGDGMAIVVVSVIILFFSKRKMIQVALSGVLSGVIAQFLKKVVFGPTPRPSAYFEDLNIPLHYVDGVELHTAFSFPSGHATAIFTLITSLVLILKRPKLDVFFIALAVIIAYSRIYLSQHFLGDIFAGSMIGIGASLTVYTLLYQTKIIEKASLDKPLFNFNTN